MIDIRTVLCPVDFTPLSERALELAVEVSKKVGARLVLEHNLESRPPSYLGVSWMWSEDHEGDQEKKAAAATGKIQELLGSVPKSIEREARLTRGPVDGTLLHLAAQLPAGLMVMGTHGASSPEHRSLTERIIIQAPCPVLTLGEGYEPGAAMAALAGTRPEAMDVVIPMDFTPRSDAALAFGLALAERMPHHMTLVHVVAAGRHAAGEADACRERLAARIPDAMSDRMTAEVRVGEPVAEILATARERGAIFMLMAARGRSAFRRFLFGTTTLGILHGSDCPVLFVPPSFEMEG
ncbi:MAG: universal stress protein [Thermoanaerobaculia bacterium]|nr:universal stress protein [Thermoanaerobaculia bacterium]